MKIVTHNEWTEAVDELFMETAFCNEIDRMVYIWARYHQDKPESDDTLLTAIRSLISHRASEILLTRFDRETDRDRFSAH